MDQCEANHPIEIEFYLNVMPDDGPTSLLNRISEMMLLQECLPVAHHCIAKSSL